MPTFYCNNSECENHLREDFYAKVTYKSTKEGLVADIDCCSRCGGRRLERKTQSQGLPSFNKWNLKSSKEKKVLLKKESHEHFQKHIKPKVIEMNRLGKNTLS